MSQYWLQKTRNQIQHIVDDFGETCDRMRLKINAGKSKVLVVKKDQRRSCEEIKEVDKFKYLGAIVSADGSRNWFIQYGREERCRRRWQGCGMRT